MSDLPAITMTGGLIEVPDLRFTPSGKAVANFRLAGKKRVRDANGTWTDGDPLYMPVVCWEGLAEHVAESLIRPGQRVVVVGRLEQSWWDDKDGTRKSKFQIVADTVALDLIFSIYTEKQAVTVSGRPVTDDPWAAPPQTDEPPF